MTIFIFGFFIIRINILLTLFSLNKSGWKYINYEDLPDTGPAAV